MRNFKVIADGSVTSPQGFLASGMHAGIKKNARKYDASLIYSEMPAVSAGVFTTNRVKAWPLYHDIKIIRQPFHRSILANSGNANCFNGAGGKTAVATTLALAAKCLKVRTDEIFVSSTGIIGREFPTLKLEQAIPALVQNLSAVGGHDAARGILTTDTRAKEIAVRFTIDGKEVTVGAMAKGAGMLYPKMNQTGNSARPKHATMLCYITTDLNISKTMLQRALSFASDETFNRIAIDNDQSTNDTVLILANGKAGNRKIVSGDKRFQLFQAALKYACSHIARELVKDGEGVTHACELVVKGARNPQEARRLCERIATSMLVKTMFAGGDPNWGRLLCCVGSSEVSFSDSLDVSFDGVPILKNGREISRNKSKLRKTLQKKEFNLTIDLKSGRHESRYWMCDLTKFYVWINSTYSS
jgi:glutamate N-acetyltransferase/amino-acid N-acetyltransferase